MKKKLKNWIHIVGDTISYITEKILEQTQEDWENTRKNHCFNKIKKQQNRVRERKEIMRIIFIWFLLNNNEWDYCWCKRKSTKKMFLLSRPPTVESLIQWRVASRDKEQENSVCCCCVWWGKLKIIWEISFNSGVGKRLKSILMRFDYDDEVTSWMGRVVVWSNSHNLSMTLQWCEKFPRGLTASLGESAAFEYFNRLSS